MEWRSGEEGSREGRGGERDGGEEDRRRQEEDRGEEDRDGERMRMGGEVELENEMIREEERI